MKQHLLSLLLIFSLFAANLLYADPVNINTATAEGEDIDGDPVNDADSHSLNIEFDPEIVVVKSGPVAANVGQTVTYSFTVTNNDLIGDGSPISNVSVIDDIAGTAIVL